MMGSGRTCVSFLVSIQDGTSGKSLNGSGVAYAIALNHSCVCCLRLYYDLDDDHPLMKKLCELACGDSNIDLCYVRKIPATGDVSKVFAMNWRFLPILDPQVPRTKLLAGCTLRTVGSLLASG